MKLKAILSYVAILLLGLVSCKSQSQEYTVPRKMNDAWQTASIETHAIKQQKLEEFYRDLSQENFPNTHAVLIVKDNQLIFEKYLNGFTARQRQYTASISKSVGSVLTGIAMQEGLLDGIENGILERNIYGLFPEYAELLRADSLKRKIHFRHILSMTGGLEWDEHSYPYSDSRNDWIAASHSKDPFVYLFNKEMESCPGSTFNYNGGYSLLLSSQIQDVSGQSALSFAEEKLFKPLEIKDYEWESLDCGLTDTDGGLHLRPRDMAKIGQLYLDQGKWNGKQIVDPTWVSESTREQVISNGMPNYGFQWWCGTFHSVTASSYTFFASGHGGQKIFVFPEYDAVVVITHQVFDNEYGEMNNIQMLSNYIIPALGGAEDENTDVLTTPEELKKYAGTYENEMEAFEIILRQEQLYVTEEGRPDMLLTAHSDGSFTSLMPEGIEVRLCFEEEEGLVTGLSVNFYFRELSYTKSL